jgi:hypothetical protein
MEGFVPIATAEDVGLQVGGPRVHAVDQTQDMSEINEFGKRLPSELGISVGCL